MNDQPVEVVLGDAVKMMLALEPESRDAIITDPPYGIDFMDKQWDSLGAGQQNYEWHLRWAREAFRVLKPGGFLLAFGGSRTYHRLASAVEDAGFELRDAIIWTYSSGFPKGRNAPAAVDKHLGVEGSYDGVKPGHEDFVDRTDAHAGGGRSEGWDRPWRDDEEAVARSHQMYVPASEEGATWEGWSTALKPAFEPIVVARKPMIGTLGRNLVEHGTGAVNIDACRVPHRSAADQDAARPQGRTTTKAGGAIGATPDAGRDIERVEYDGYDNSKGRWPTNVLMSHSPDCVLVGETVAEGDHRGPYEPGRRGQVFMPGAAAGDPNPNSRMYGDEVVDLWDCAPGCPVALLDAQAGERRSGTPGTMRLGRNTGAALGAESRAPGTPMTGYGDVGGASRFYPTFDWDLELDMPLIYQAKAARSERDAGLEGFELRPIHWSSGDQSPGTFQSPGTLKAARNDHPTVKPVELMRWLLRLVVRPGGRILDPFVGSGTTAVAAVIEGVELLGFENKPRYVDIAEARIAHAGRVRNAVLAGRTKLRAARRQPEQDEAEGQSSLW